MLRACKEPFFVLCGFFAGQVGVIARGAKCKMQNWRFIGEKLQREEYVLFWKKRTKKLLSASRQNSPTNQNLSADARGAPLRVCRERRWGEERLNWRTLLPPRRLGTFLPEEGLSYIALVTIPPSKSKILPPPFTQGRLKLLCFGNGTSK